MSEGRVLVKNAGDAEQVKGAREKEKLGRERELDDLRQVLALAAGRRLVWRLLTEAGIEGSRRYAAGGETSAEYNQNAGVVDGMRRVGTTFARDAEAAAPELYDKMRQEARQATGG